MEAPLSLQVRSLIFAPPPPPPPPFLIYLHSRREMHVPVLPPFPSLPPLSGASNDTVMPPPPPRRHVSVPQGGNLG